MIYRISNIQPNGLATHRLRTTGLEERSLVSHWKWSTVQKTVTINTQQTKDTCINLAQQLEVVMGRGQNGREVD